MDGIKNVAALVDEFDSSGDVARLVEPLGSHLVREEDAADGDGCEERNQQVDPATDWRAIHSGSPGSGLQAKSRVAKSISAENGSKATSNTRAGPLLR